MRKKAYIIGGMLLVMLLIAVFIAYGLRNVELTAADNGSEIELKKGQSLVITLEATPVTGHTWKVVKPPDEQILRQVGEIEFRLKSGLAGAKGVQIIRFEAVDEGRTALRLVLYRTWETDEEPLETFTVQVVVR